MSPSMIDIKFLLVPDIVKEANIQASPLKRLLAVDDVAPVFEFLLSSGADTFTGQNIAVTGGSWSIMPIELENKTAFISYKHIASKLNIQKGDIVMVSSDIKRLIWTTTEHGEKFDIDVFIDTLITEIGDNGTLLFPTYNWDFCRGIAFDYCKTPPHNVGSLGKAALKRGDFRRTQHPIYSFAVWGKDKEHLYNMNNIGSFGVDSPFAYLHKYAKALQMDVPLKQCFTFAHYVEEQVGVPYRFLKTFTAPYIDAHGNSNIRSYNMYVRYLDMNVKIVIDPIEDELTEAGIIQRQTINGIPFTTLMFSDFYKAAKQDILENNARKLSTYDGPKTPWKNN